MSASSARILVGLRGPLDAPEGNFVAWQQGLSGEGECHFERISDSGTLPEDTEIFGTDGADHILVLPSRLIHYMPPFHPAKGSFEFCGHEWRPPSFAADGTEPSDHGLTVHAGGGDDLVFAQLQDAPLTVEGEGGKDRIVVDSALAVHGGGGDDFLIAWSMPTGGLYGDGGADTLCWGDDHIAPWPLARIDGGGGRDDCFSTQADHVASCENLQNLSPTSNPSSFRKYCDLPARAVRSALDSFSTPVSSIQ